MSETERQEDAELNRLARIIADRIVRGARTFEDVVLARGDAFLGIDDHITGLIRQGHIGSAADDGGRAAAH